MAMIYVYIPGAKVIPTDQGIRFVQKHFDRVAKLFAEAIEIGKTDVDAGVKHLLSANKKVVEVRFEYAQDRSNFYGAFNSKYTFILTMHGSGYRLTWYRSNRRTRCEYMLDDGMEDVSNLEHIQALFATMVLEAVESHKCNPKHNSPVTCTVSEMDQVTYDKLWHEQLDKMYPNTKQEVSK